MHLAPATKGLPPGRTFWTRSTCSGCRCRHRPQPDDQPGAPASNGREHGSYRAKLLVSALGNSGNIASGFFTGFIAEDPLKDIYQAAKAGRDRAWQALADPKPGTMLTVFDELLNHLEHAPLDQLAATYPALIEKLENAVHSTAETLPALKAAGVVDAGALGIFLFMEGFFGRLAGRTDGFRPVTETFKQKLQLPADFAPDHSERVLRRHGDPGR